MSSEVRVRLRVRGTVQGVFYRASTLEVAGSMGLKGFVQNLPDGSVVVEAQGPGAQVESLQRWCQRGPANAVVEGVEAEAIEAISGEEGFQVRY